MSARVLRKGENELHTNDRYTFYLPIILLITLEYGKPVPDDPERHLYVQIGDYSIL